MPGADDVARSVGELSKGQGQALDALSGAAAGAGNAAHGLSDFFRSTDNLLALVVCLLAVAGVYRLLRSENIIPAPSREAGGSVFAALPAPPAAPDRASRACPCRLESSPTERATSSAPGIPRLLTC